MTQDHKPWDQRPRLALWLLLCAALAGLVAALAHAYPEAVRTPQDWAQVGYSAGLVVLVATGVFRAGRVFRPEHLRHAALWAAIVAVLALGFAYRGELTGVGQHLRLAFSGGEPVVTGERELVIPQAEDGGFVVVGKVDGQRVRFIVDTGATDTVLSPDDARRAGVDTDSLRYGLEAETANGTGYGAPHVAGRLEIGPIVLTRFPVTVNRAPMSASLLGMSFLRRLESFHVEDQKLVLRWREAEN